MQIKKYYVYILTNKFHTVLYTGVTSNLVDRVLQHKNGQIAGFTKIYKCKKLIYFEETDNVEVALQREKQLKKWKRSWKEELIHKDNSKWEDLFDEL